MLSHETFKYFAPLGIIVILVLAGIIIHRDYQGKSVSLSLHAASSKRLSYIFGAALTLNAFFFYVFALKWLAPTYQLPSLFMQIFTLTIIGQLITAWVPDRKGIERKIHNIAAYGFSATMPILSLFLATSPNANSLLKIVATVAACVMTALIGLMVVSAKVRQHHLVVQVVYAASFYIMLLVAAFAGQF